MQPATENNSSHTQTEFTHFSPLFFFPPSVMQQHSRTHFNGQPFSPMTHHLSHVKKVSLLSLASSGGVYWTGVVARVFKERQGWRG